MELNEPNEATLKKKTNLGRERWGVETPIQWGKKWGQQKSELA